MRARSRVVVEAGGRLAHVDCQAPLTIRRVRSDDAANCALCLVGTAAGPLAGDDLALDLELRDGARATLQATGAGIAQGGGGHRALRSTAVLAPRTHLVARPQPVIVAHGARIDVSVRLDLAEDAAVEWHELLVLGRTGEPPGGATLRWDVTRAGRPVLRQFVDLAEPSLAAWGGMTGAHRVLATVLITDPARRARTVVHCPTAVSARLDEHTSLVTVLGDDAAQVAAQVEAALEP